MNPVYQHFFRGYLLLFPLLFFNIVNGQTLSTAAAVNYNASSVVPAGSAGTVTFTIQNSNPQARVLSKIDCFARTDQPGNVYKLWYSANSVSGAVSIAPPVWVLIATGNAVSATSDGLMTVLDNINFPVPGNTQYRFALQTSNGIAYTGSTAGTPSPNSFSSAGVTLKVGNNQVAGQNVGYAGNFPNPTDTPAFFTGAVYFVPCTSYTIANAPVITSDTSSCGAGNAVTLRILGGSLNQAARWNWYAGVCGGAAAGTGTSLTVSPGDNTTYYARGEGGCAFAPGLCTPVTVSIIAKPGRPVINTAAPICNGTLAHLVINPTTLSTTPVPDSITVASAVLAIAVPDNSAAGASASLTVPAIPAGSQVTGIDVSLNMLHSYPGDMIFNLKSPDGFIANLYKYNTGVLTGNFRNMSNSGWINAVTSSAGNVAYNSVDSPYRYNAGVLFKPDLINTAVAGKNIQNPNGFVSNSLSMTALYNMPNGVWTLAMADGGAGGVGTLTGWSIKIKYNRFTQEPASPAVWSPATTLFVDGAGAVPYDGTTPKMDIYAKPAATTIYTAISVRNGCYSSATNSTVTVNIAISNGNTNLPADDSTCEAGTAVFKTVATGTNPTYQWQTDNGTGTFVNIANNSNYTGTNTDSLTINNVPLAWNNYYYRCVISSGAPCIDTIHSRTALLKINKAPDVALSATTTSLFPGMLSTLGVVSTPVATSYNWIKNNVHFNGSITSSYIATIDDIGTYKVSVVDTNGCTGLSNGIVITDSASGKLFIYPNPSINGKFAVSYYSVKGNILPRILTIYNAKGALVLKELYSIEKPYYKMEVSFSRFGRGIYFINLADRNGKRLATGKIIVQ